MTSGHFDETDLKSFYYASLTFEDAAEILLDQEQGVFFIRDSKRGGYVICVKEQNEVMQYPVQTKQGANHQTWLYVREECPFRDLAALLSFYKRNLFKSTALIRPIARDRITFHQLRTGQATAGERRTMIPRLEADSRFPLPTSEPPHGRSSRNSAPPEMTRQISNQPGIGTRSVLGRVVKPKVPIAYETSSLELKVGEIIKISNRKNGQGYGEVVSTGKKGNFPLTHVELIDSNDLLESQE